MSASFKSFLAQLRDIGWSEWDPIGLSSDKEDCIDEYDSYLLVAAGKLANGADERRVADYLINVEEGHMGLGKSALADNRALVTTRRIAALIEKTDF
ncbi:MAG: hypothetical protein AAF376_08165 [Pseudomonadota bacterium]